MNNYPQINHKFQTVGLLKDYISNRSMKNCITNFQKVFLEILNLYRRYSTCTYIDERVTFFHRNLGNFKKKRTVTFITCLIYPSRYMSGCGVSLFFHGFLEPRLNKFGSTLLFFDCILNNTSSTI